MKFRAIILCCIAVISCREKPVDFPHGFQLRRDAGGSTYLNKSTGFKLIPDPVSQFCFREHCLYGWIDNKEESFFFLDTDTGKLTLFANWDKIDAFLIKRGFPRLSMKDSFTYLDIKTGYKKKPW